MQQSLPSIIEVARAGTFGLKLPILPANPFVGLRPFSSDEALLYFGRREQTIELMQQLHRTHFVAIVGSSGCGKSSLVRAGLIPKLKAGFLIEERDQWLVATMKPGDAPLYKLAEALSSAVNEPSTNLIAAVNESNTSAIIEWLEPKLTGSDANLLLLIDQFEELFRFGGLELNKPENRAEAMRFVELMLTLSRQRQLPIYVVMTMRSDFIGDCDNFYGLPEAMNQSQYLVPRLTREQLRQAIEGPIQLFGGEITPQLVERVLSDVGDKSDQLPVMQHALMRTWEQWESSILNPQSSINLSHYEATGGIAEALSRDADAALNSLSIDEHKIAEKMFQALTDTDEKNRRVRRPVHLSELCAITWADTETIDKIIEQFTSGGRSFLTWSEGVDPDDPLIDISHESLIRQWKKLGEWIDDENNSREIYRRLAGAAKRREKLGAHPYSGPDLIEAWNWRESKKPNFDWAKRYDSHFFEAMKFLEESRATEEEARRRLIEDAKAETKRQRKELLRTRLFALIVTILLIGAALLAWYAWRQQHIAVEGEQKSQLLVYAVSMNLATNAFDGKNSTRGYELLNQFLPAGNDKPDADLREFYWFYLWQENHLELNTFKGHEAQVLSVAFAPDGKTLASAGSDQTIRLWDARSGQLLNTLKGHEAYVWSVAFAPDGKTIASAGSDDTIKLWDARSGQLLNTLKTLSGQSPLLLTAR